jgi:hypothetical protein
MNIVEQFHAIANELSIPFTYGTKSSLNLVIDKLETDDVAIGMDSGIKRKPIKGDYNVIDYLNYKGTLLFVKNGNPQNTIYNENNFDAHGGEFYTTILPMIEKMDEFFISLSACNGFERVEWESQEGYDVFNKSVNVLLVTYDIDIK